MKPKFYTFVLSVIILGMIGCKSASKLYEKGNYDQAVELAVKKLQKDPEDEKLKSIVQNAYLYAVDDHESNIRGLSNSNNELKWESVYREYESLQRLHDAIRSAPTVYRVVKPTDYSSVIADYKEKAAEVRYARAMRLMENDDKQSYQGAYREFQVALSLRPGDLGIQEKMHQAYEEAVVHVVVMPLETSSYMYSSSYQMRNLEDQLIRNLRYSVSNEFVKFYSRWEAGNIVPDQIVETRFDQMNIGRYHDDRDSRQVSKQVVIKEIVHRPDSIEKVYGTVYAKIITTQRRVYSEGTLSIVMRDGSTGQYLFSDQFRGEHRWSTEFATFTGDERALSENDRQLINRRENFPPREDEIVDEILRCINNDMQSRMRYYFR